MRDSEPVYRRREPCARRPVSAVFAVHPFASGTIGLVMPSAVRVVDAADRAREVDDAVGLTALQHGDSNQRPAVDDVALQRVLSRKSGIWKT